jgi:dihydrofolate reductase
MAATLLYTSVSVDGYATGRDGDLTRLHRWLFDFEQLTGREVADAVTARFRSAGSIIFGRRTFDSGQDPWGDDDVFDSPVFVVTHEAREPVARNGTVFTFVSGDPARILDRARAAAGAKDVVIMGSPDVAIQFLRAGLIDELVLHVVPVLLGAGTRLFGDLASPIELEFSDWMPAGEVAMVTYAVIRRD